MLTRLSSKGQLVIPKAVREALGLRPGAQFRVRFSDRGIVLELVSPTAAHALYGRYSDLNLLADMEAEHRQEVRDETTVCP
jgi:AbrB family looped-hinge helix DNA binding protein